MTPRTRRRLTRAARIAIPVSILAIIVLAISTVGFVEVSSQPSFCGSCHIMKPYYDSWTTSSHRDIACIQCHIAPGIKAEAMTKVQAANMVVKYFTGTANTRPWARMDDAACLRSGCHSARLIEGQVDYKGVRFDHTRHLGQVRRGIELHCTSCHSQIVQGSHIAVTEGTCVLCHFKGRPENQPLGGCVGCHPSPPRVTSAEGSVVDHPQYVKDRIDCVSCHAEVTQGSGDADAARCVSCHNEPDRLRQFNNAPMLHRVHVGQENVACIQCHTGIDHRIVSLTTTAQLDCKSCHSNVHSAQQKLYAGIGGHGTPRGPSSMYQARVSCVGCHNDESRRPGHATVQSASESACLSCHGVRYANVLPGWERSMERKLGLVEPVVARARASTAGLPLRQRAVADSLLAMATENVALVRSGKGVHNIVYADQLLRASLNLVQQAGQVRNASYRLPAVDLGPPVSDNECLQCHLGVEQRRGTLDGRTFDHTPHVVRSGMQCKACHTSLDNHGGTSVRSGADCDACHHPQVQAQSRNCAQCHRGGAGAPTDTVRAAAGNFTHRPHLEAGSACGACHTPPSMSARSLDCDQCHSSHHQPEAACLGCHRGGTLAKHKVADHVACSQCHTSVPGLNRWSRQVCTSCHTTQVNHQPGRACESCHNIPAIRAGRAAAAAGPA